MKNLKTFKKLLALGGVTLILMTASGCSKKADCPVTAYHVHRYVDSSGYVRYIDQEYVSYEGYERTDDYYELSDNKKKIYSYMDQKDLLRIEDNVELIKKAIEDNVDFVEYQYVEHYTRLMPMKIGKAMTVIPIRGTRYKWTRDPNHEGLTGKKRYCTYSYTSYKIEIDEYGNYVLIPSLEHANILETKDEYPYIKRDFFKVIDAGDGHEVDYEEEVVEEKDEASKVLKKEFIA